LSSDPDAMMRESGENTPVRTQFWCPTNEPRKRLVSVLKSLRSLSSEAVSRRLPSVLKLTSRTGMLCARITLAFPSTVFFQSLTELSKDPEATRFPSGCMLTEVTALVWPVQRNGRIECLKFQTLMVLSLEPDTTCLSEGLKATVVTVSLCPLKHLFRVGS